MKSKSYKVMVTDIPISALQAIAAKLHKATGGPAFEIKDDDFGSYAAIANFTAQ